MWCSTRRLACITVALVLEVFSSASVQAEPSDIQDAPVCTEDSGCKDRQTYGASLLQTKSQKRDMVLVEEDEEEAAQAISDDETDRIELVDSQTATTREGQRTKLTIEMDLSKLHASYYRMWNPSETCSENANKAFEHLLEKLGEGSTGTAEMNAEEKVHYKARFVSEMEHDCKVDPDIARHWQGDVAKASEHEKPAMTQALSQSINGAKLGYKVKMSKWLLTESVNSFSLRCGKVVPAGENHTMFVQTQKHLEEHAASGKQASVPTSFDSATAWPTCRAVIKKAHNQGVCGSCWAFGAAGTLDSRLCIATNGRFQAQVSRGYATSCKRGTRDGCQGGLAKYAYEMAGGLPTGGSTGCSPYFGHGEGTDHFQQQSSAPPCPSACHNTNGYPRTLAADKFNLPSITFREIWPTNAQGNRMAKESMMAHGPLSFGVAASGRGFMGYSSGVLQNGCARTPNHEVYAYGWGRNTFLGMNSWGAHWGLNGGFEIAECSVTDWTIVGDIRADVPGLPLPIPPPGSPPAPPAPSPGPRPSGSSTWNVVSGSCVKDAQGCISSTNYPLNYPNRDRCTIRPAAGFGQIEVVDFNTENRYDKVIVNGYGISGSGHNTRPSLHHDLAPTGDITWTSDGSEVKTGWKLCPRNPVAPANLSTTRAPATTTSASPTTVPATTTPASPTTVPATTTPASPTTVPATPSTTPAPVSPQGGGAAWNVISGSCVKDARGCISSPNYPQNYPNSDQCTIHPEAGIGQISVVAFNTERTWDKLIVNGNSLSGRGRQFTDLVPTGDITWTSDSSVAQTGWKLCPREATPAPANLSTTPAPATPAPATPAPTPAPVPATTTPAPATTTAAPATTVPATPSPVIPATTTVLPAPAGMWTVEGPCPVVGNCVTSSNYPAAYNNGEACTIMLLPHVITTIDDFETEAEWDRLQINGVTLSGSHGEKAGISVTSPISWTSDGGTNNRGWKLCAAR